METWVLRRAEEEETEMQTKKGRQRGEAEAAPATGVSQTPSPRYLASDARV